MLKSLRIKLLAIILLCVFLAVGLTAVIANRTTATEFNQYVARDFDQEQAAIVSVVEERLLDGSLADAQMTIDSLSSVHDIPITIMEGDTILYSSPNTEAWGEIIIPLPDPHQATSSSFARETRTITYTTHEEFEEAMANPPPSTVGVLAFPIDAVLEPVTHRLNETLFLTAVQQQLLLAGGVAILLAGIMSLGLSQRMIKPIEALTHAAKHMEQGDLSQRVSITSQDEIGLLGHAFNAMADRLQTQEHLRKQMVTDIAHELRTPLANIRGYLEAIQDGLVTADNATINSLHEESLLLNHLIDDLQEIALADAGQLQLNIQETDIVQLIQQMVAHVQPTVVAKSITLSTNIPTNLPLIQADPLRLGQVLRNVLQNAIRHTPEEGAVHVTAVATPHTLNIEINDTGEGIPPQHLPHIFDRFYRANTARSRHAGGAGLGLAIAQAIVELHQGNISATSTLGSGTTFYISLPL